ncbi:MAG: hypothetical protein MJZ74_07605 [Muribaculaceae bacterium]|nr:hypothetical protein [Muribaculaceae bacterium]
MKRTALFTVMMTIMMALSFSANAQQNDGKQEGRRQFNPEQAIQHRAQSIANKLNLDDATTAKFMDTYKAYLKEMHGVYAKYGQGMGGKKKDEGKTDAQVEQDIKNQFAMSRAIIDVREKYYTKFRAFLNPRQIKVVYAQERDNAHRMKGEKERRGQGGPRGGQGGRGAHGPNNGQPAGRNG